MGLPQLEMSLGSYIEIYTPPSPRVQAAAQFRKSVRIWNRDLPNLPTLLQYAFGSPAKGDRELSLGLTRQGAMIYSDDLLAVAKRIGWLELQKRPLNFPKRFLTYALT
jgi:hypothetical protein